MSSKRTSGLLCTVTALTGLILCSCTGSTVQKTEPLTVARKSFHTRLVKEQSAHQPMPAPPPNLFDKIDYVSPAGKLGAYLSKTPTDGKKHPAIVWITGGDCNTIDEGVWTEGSSDNDQSACIYRKLGIVMMFPSLRGGNENPGAKEGFLGEVDDVIAAADYLSHCPSVDPNRIYLGGHSSGGTLALLVSECTPRFRAVFSFGPAGDISGYRATGLFPYINFSNAEELHLRSPGYWLSSIKSPTYVIEGTDENSNIRELESMRNSCKNPLVHFEPVEGATHFSDLALTNQNIAAQILTDTGASPDFKL